MQLPPREDIENQVRAALLEDIGSGDISASLIPATRRSRARVISREPGILCGSAWVDEVFRQLDPGLSLRWHLADGDRVSADTVLFELEGASRSLLSGERTALNFLQLLSGTASLCADYAARVDGTGVRLLDTRKTLPGLRTAQKYAVTCGGCFNHRMGLYDAFLIKENHIAACGAMQAAVDTARRRAPGKPVAVEVESLAQLRQALEVGVERIMLDNFNTAQLHEAVALNRGRAELEASGGITGDRLREIAKTGVDYISIGALTKHSRALDLSLRLLD